MSVKQAMDRFSGSTNLKIKLLVSPPSKLFLEHPLTRSVRHETTDDSYVLETPTGSLCIDMMRESETIQLDKEPFVDWDSRNGSVIKQRRIGPQVITNLNCKEGETIVRKDFLLHAIDGDDSK